MLSVTSKSFMLLLSVFMLSFVMLNVVLLSSSPMVKNFKDLLNSTHSNQLSPSLLQQYFFQNGLA